MPSSTNIVTFRNTVMLRNVNAVFPQGSILKIWNLFKSNGKKMSRTFTISYRWDKLSKPDYFLETVDATKIFTSLSYFLSLYKGEFIISVQEHDACFDLRPDLYTIFEDIPLVLCQLTKDTHSPVEFDFFEQGTDVGMFMERQGDTIKVRFENKWRLCYEVSVFAIY